MQVHLCVFVFVYTCVQWLCPGRPHSLSMGSSFHDLETIFTTGSHAARVGAGSKARHTITPRAPCSRDDMKIRYLRHVSARAPQAGPTPPVTTFSERVPLRCTRRHRTFQTHRARARARVRVPTCDMSVARPRTAALRSSNLRLRHLREIASFDLRRSVDTKDTRSSAQHSPGN